MCTGLQSCSSSTQEIARLTPPLKAQTAPQPPLRVAFGQATFDAEGSESRGLYRSRILHWPGGSSGVTIGRGYDMGHRTPLQIVSELTYAGVTHDDARWFSQAALLRGESARRFVERERGGAPELSLAAQKRLFEVVTTNETIADIKRIMGKPDVVARYGAKTWDELSQPVQEILFDLRYRGDYTPTTRQVIQPLVTANDLDGLRRAMYNTDYWAALGVPRDRIERRKAIADTFEVSDPVRKVA